MKYQLKLTDNAKHDIKESFIWYNNQRENLGIEFLQKVEEIIENIKHNPNQFASINKKIRRALTNKFPYSILFIINETKIIVFAIFHTSRNPKTWKQRLN